MLSGNSSRGFQIPTGGKEDGMIGRRTEAVLTDLPLLKDQLLFLAERLPLRKRRSRNSSFFSRIGRSTACRQAARGESLLSGIFTEFWMPSVSGSWILTRAQRTLAASAHMHAFQKFWPILNPSLFVAERKSPLHQH